MYRKLVLLFAFSILIVGTEIQHGWAYENLQSFQNDEISVLLLVTSEQTAESASVKKLDMLLRHFTKDVSIVLEGEAERNDFKEVTHLVYYGEHERSIRPEVIQAVDEFAGTMIGIGKNVEQFSAFSGFEIVEKVQITEVRRPSDQNVTLLDYPFLMNRVKETSHMNVLLTGQKGSLDLPLLSQIDDRYYFAPHLILDWSKYYLAEALHHIFPNDHPHEHMAYLRLEDIHPMSDPDKLLEIGEYLNDRNIPYVLVVIPVYITPETGERVHFSSSPNLVEVLQYLQSTGGTVIAHGYTHQYRDSETGEGFEFWDVENDQFIISHEPKEKLETILSKEYFPSARAYEEYIHPLQSRERAYIEERLENSIHELVSFGLYPLAFEAPHYTMSRQGYALAANYFSTIFGQVQLSDERWEEMGTPPYLSSGDRLHNLVLYPETIGYVDVTELNPFHETGDRIERALLVRDSVIGGFYHPYLGIDYLPEFLAYYERVPNLKWLDFKKTKQHVQTSKVQISSDATGEIAVTNEVTWLENLMRTYEPTLLEKILWLVTAIVFMFVILFFIITIRLRTQLRKRLFRERKSFG